MKRKGQLTLGDAPSVVLLVGLTFLVMATMAYISFAYGNAIPSDHTSSVSNETFTITTAGTRVAGGAACNFDTFSVKEVRNATVILNTGNYTVGATGTIANKTSMALYGTALNVTYTYTYSGTACNVTDSLELEIANNTSIAGIVLTISLVGIVLSVLIGVFVAARSRGL